MGTWEEESRELHETQNEANVDAPSNGIHHDKNDGDVDVDVEVEIFSDGGHDHHECKVVEEDALTEKLERIELQNNGSDDSKIEYEKPVVEPGEDEDDEEGQPKVYPFRPYAVDCSFYLKTGTCKFGPNCRYNHPLKGDFQPVVDKDKGFEASNGAVVNAGKIDCKYFLTPGGCKYGDACRYNHSTRKPESGLLVLNFLGLPIRPSAQECTFYLRNGSCGYGANCRFNHPDPSVAKELEPVNAPGNEISGRGATNFPRNYICEPSKSFGASQGTSELSNGINLRNGLAYAPEMGSYLQPIPQNPVWNPNQVFSSSSVNKAPLPHQMMNNYSKAPDSVTHYEKLMQIEEFPERPGQPDCDYFMKTGNCKYRSACRYNHPVSGASKLCLPTLPSKGLYSRPATVVAAGTPEHSNLNFNHTRNNGLPSAHFQQQQMQNGEFPERPGETECEYYMKTGQCKFKSACRYHHPRSRVTSPSLCALSENGLPLRPGAKLCRNYEQQGMCKYGLNCLFNHPDDYSPATQVAAPVHRSTNVAVTAHLEPSAVNSVQSGWDDGWGM